MPTAGYSNSPGSQTSAGMASSDVDRLWQLVGSIRFCMPRNKGGARLHSRPMGAFVRRDEGTIYFFCRRLHRHDWKSRDNPYIRLIKVTPLEAEFWDFPGYLISSLTTAFALAIGGYPKAGKHEKISL